MPCIDPWMSVFSAAATPTTMTITSTITTFLPKPDVATSWLSCGHLHENRGRMSGYGSVLAARRLR
jgi:hypothetical protein